MKITFHKSDGGTIVFFRKYNPCHDRRGRFASASSGAFLYSPGQIRYRNKKPPKQLTGPGRSGKVSSPQTVTLPDGSISQISPGTKIIKIVRFAGRGTEKELRAAGRLSRKYGNLPKDWSKVRGDGYVDFEGAPKHCELHWYEASQTGRVQMKVKRWFNEG